MIIHSIDGEGRFVDGEGMNDRWGKYVRSLARVGKSLISVGDLTYFVPCS